MAEKEDDIRQDEHEGGQDISVTDARAGQRVGLIWVLLISLVLAAGGLLGYSTLNSRHMSTASNGEGANQTALREAQDFKAAQSAPVTGAPPATN